MVNAIICICIMVFGVFMLITKPVIESGWLSDEYRKKHGDNKPRNMLTGEVLGGRNG